MRQQAARAFTISLFVLTLYLLYRIFLPFLSAIAWAVFLATAFHPMYRRMLRVLGGRETLAAVLSTMVVVALILLPMVLLISSLTSTVADMLADAKVLRDVAEQVEAAPAGVPLPGELAGPEVAIHGSTTTASAARPPLHTPTAPAPAQPGPGHDAQTSGGGDRAGSAAGGGHFPFVARISEILSPWVKVSGEELEGMILTGARQLAQIAAAQGGALLQNAVLSIAMAVIATFTMVYFFREGPKIVQAAANLMPLRPADRDAVLARLHEVTRAVFYGVIMTSAIQAALGGIGWALAGLPSAMTAGIGMFFASLIPIGGTFLVWGPGAIWLMLKGHPIAGVFLAVWGFAIVGLVDNVLRPYFISGRTHMHTLLVFFGVLGGMAAFGVAGLFLGPLVITLFLSLLEVIRRDLFPPEVPAPPGPPAAPPPGP